MLNLLANWRKDPLKPHTKDMVKQREWGKKNTAKNMFSDFSNLTLKLQKYFEVEPYTVFKSV